MAGLFLLGTIHLDIKSAPSLLAALHDLRPDIVTVEISKYSVEFRRKQYPVWKNSLRMALKSVPIKQRAHPQIRLLKRQITMPYEWSVAKEYCDTSSIPCIPVDSSLLAKKELPAWKQDLLAPENVKFLVKGPWFSLESYFLKHHKTALDLWERPHPPGIKTTLSFLKRPFWRQREKTLAVRLKRFMGLGCRLVHIGGWMHFLDSIEHATLYSQLADLVCEKRLILRN